MTKKYDATLNNVTWSWQNHPGVNTLHLACGSLTEKEINIFLEEVAESEIPEYSCIHYMGANFQKYLRKKVFVGSQDGITEYKNSGLDVDIRMKNYHRCSRSDCFNNIGCGKCTDEFVRNLIGKHLLKNIYQKQK